MNIAVPIIAASTGIWPEWFAINSTRPVGTLAVPYASQRKYFR